MKTMIFRGESVNLVRLGLVKPGQVLKVTEFEYMNILKAKDKRFELVADEKPDRGVEYVPPIPTKTVFYDLRTINWRNTSIVLYLDRLTKGRIVQIGRAMKHLGLIVDTATKLQKREIIDSIVSEAREAGWLSMEQVVAKDAVKFGGGEASEAEEESASVHPERKATPSSHSPAVPAPQKPVVAKNDHRRPGVVNRR